MHAKEAIAAVLEDVLLDDDNAENQFSNSSKALRPSHRCAAIFQCISLLENTTNAVLLTSF